MYILSFFSSFRRVPFQQALQLISSRAVYLEGGYAYVPLGRLVSIITTRVRLPPSFPFLLFSH
jgi:hypothetical protein